MAQYVCFGFFYFVLCFFVGASEKHECDRLCLQNEPPKMCIYQFTIGVSTKKNEEPNFHRKPLLTINGKQPGPLISVCQNDTVLVNVSNQLPFGIETSLHWHGVSEGISPFMDGVPMVTQCPIFPRTTFRYQLRALTPGTFYYRAHSVAQQLDGLYGPLVIRGFNDLGYPSRIILISPRVKSLQILEDSFERDLNVTHIQVDAFEDFTQKRLDSKSTFERLRLINAAALDCPITAFTHAAPLRVVALDGHNVNPQGVNEVVINPGERVDLLIKPEIMKVTHLVGNNLCKGHAIYGFTSGISEKIESTDDHVVRKSNYMMEKLKPKEPEKLEKSDLNVFISLDVSVYKNFNGTVDFRYKLGATTPYAPSLLTKNLVTIYQVGKKSFLYSPSPILSQPNDIPEDIICDLENISGRCEADNNDFCECLQILHLPYNKNVDLFLINEGKESDLSETIHVHGYSFHVLSVKSFNKSITVKDIMENELLEGDKRNLVNPIKKDTILVPNKGYVVIRLKTKNPGKWLIESTTSKAPTDSGVEIIMSVENPASPQIPPKNFPTCGSKKDPDLVFSPD